jgi:hypothetical protein
MTPALPVVTPVTFLAIQWQEVIGASVHEHDCTGTRALVNGSAVSRPLAGAGSPRDHDVVNLRWLSSPVPGGGTSIWVPGITGMYGWTLMRCSCAPPCFVRTFASRPAGRSGSTQTPYADPWKGGRSWPRPSPMSWGQRSCPLTGVPLYGRETSPPPTGFRGCQAGSAAGGWPSSMMRSTQVQPFRHASARCATAGPSRRRGQPAVPWPGERNG